MKAWNDRPGGREASKAKRKVLAAKLARAVKTRRAAAAMKYKAGRKIGPR